MTEPCLTGDLRTPGKRRARSALLLSRRRLSASAGWIPSPNFSSRGGTKVTGIVIHTAEGARTVGELGAFFGRASSQVSSHVGIDDAAVAGYVDPKFEAWTLRNGNPWTENAELCGFASWSRATWLDQHRPMMRNAAGWVADRCKARGIHPVHITADDIRAGRRSGYFDHYAYTLGTGDGTHHDVGTSFPWDVFEEDVHDAYYGPQQPTEPMEDDMPYLIRRTDNGAIALIDGELFMPIDRPGTSLTSLVSRFGNAVNLDPPEFDRLTKNKRAATK